MIRREGENGGNIFIIIIIVQDYWLPVDVTEKIGQGETEHSECRIGWSDGAKRLEVTFDNHAMRSGVEIGSDARSSLAGEEDVEGIWRNRAWLKWNGHLGTNRPDGEFSFENG